MILFLWVNRDCIVLGRNQNLLAECNSELANADGVKIARRKTGGGCVFHDEGNINFSFIAPADLYNQVKQLQVIICAAKKFGIDIVMNGRNDLEYEDGVKCSGNAFLQRNDTCLHHGTILVHVNLDKLSKYLTPSKEKLNSKGIKSVRSRVRGLDEVVAEISVSQMLSTLVQSAKEVYGQKFVVCELTKNERIFELEQEYSNIEWIQRREA